MSVDVTPSELDPKLLSTVVEYHAQVEEARREFEDAKERLKSRKNRLESLQESFETAFRRLITKGGELPLFANQSEMVEAANNDPVVSSIVDRLLERGFDVNAVLVAGYTEDERNEVIAYLDAADAVAEGDQEPEPPAFLTPQLTAVEIADLITRLADAELSVEADTIESWGPGSLHDVRAWLDACDAVTAEKGDAIVVDDLPPAPAWLIASMQSEDDDEAADDEQDDEPEEDVDDEIEPEGDDADQDDGEVAH